MIRGTMVVIVTVMSRISPFVFGIMRHVLFIKTIKWVCIVSIEHVMTIVIGIITMVSSVIMVVIRITMFPMGISIMMTNIIVLITWKMFLSTSVMVIGWLASRWCYVGWMV